MSCEEIFRTALQESGIEYHGPIYVDGKLHRIKADGDHSKNSWYVLYPGSPVAGAYGCWKRDLKQTWCERNGSLTESERKSVGHRWQQAGTKLAAETVARQERARKIAAFILNRSRPASILHRYLARKHVKVFGNMRLYRRSLVLPLHDIKGELQSLQFVGGDGEKYFLTGGRVAGCLFTLADKADGPLMICEGYATGASIHEATSGAVICSLNCGNLLDVAKAARESWPQREIIIAADNDQFTEGNPGLTKATAAAKAVRAKLAVPKFKNTANNPTDFNDLATGEDLDAVKEQIGAAQIPTETDAEAFSRLAALFAD
jgi:putative DNA primase/helicase